MSSFLYEIHATIFFAIHFVYSNWNVFFPQSSDTGLGSHVSVLTIKANVLDYNSLLYTLHIAYCDGKSVFMYLNCQLHANKHTQTSNTWTRCWTFGILRYIFSIESSVLWSNNNRTLLLKLNEHFNSISLFAFAFFP